MAIKKCISSLISRAQYSTEYHLEDFNGKDSFKPDISNVNIRYEENLPLIEFDKEQFEKALIYILFYIISHIDSTGRIAISSNMSPSEDRDQFIHITITGIGCRLSEAEMQQLFDPFNIEQSNSIDVGPSIAQKIIEEHGGRLDVRREKDGNASFVISLPVSR